MDPLLIGISCLVLALLGAGTGIYLVKLQPRRDPIAGYVTVALFVFACSIGMRVAGFWPAALGFAVFSLVYFVKTRQQKRAG